MALALAADHQFARPPVDVLQLQGDHLLRPQSQAGQQRRAGGDRQGIGDGDARAGGPGRAAAERAAAAGRKVGGQDRKLVILDAVDQHRRAHRDGPIIQPRTQSVARRVGDDETDLVHVYGLVRHPADADLRAEWRRGEQGCEYEKRG